MSRSRRTLYTAIVCSLISAVFFAGCGKKDNTINSQVPGQTQQQPSSGADTGTGTGTGSDTGSGLPASSLIDQSDEGDDEDTGDDDGPAIDDADFDELDLEEEDDAGADEDEEDAEDEDTDESDPADGLWPGAWPGMNPPTVPEECTDDCDDAADLADDLNRRNYDSFRDFRELESDYYDAMEDCNRCMYSGGSATVYGPWQYYSFGPQPGR